MDGLRYRVRFARDLAGLRPAREPVISPRWQVTGTGSPPSLLYGFFLSTPLLPRKGAGLTDPAKTAPSRTEVRLEAALCLVSLVLVCSEATRNPGLAVSGPMGWCWLCLSVAQRARVAV